MRVLLVSGHGADRTYGGAERYVDDLARSLTARGHQIEVLSAFPVRDSAWPPAVTLHDTDWREDRLRRHRNHVDDWLAAPWPRLEPVLRDLAPDLVHTSNLPGISTGLWEQARRQGIPVVHTLHDYHLLCPRTSLTKADGSPCRPSPLLCGLRSRRLSRWADAVRVAIGVSGHVLGRHQGFFGPKTDRRVIRAPLMPLGGAEPIAPASPPKTLGYIGVLTESKGLVVLLEAAPRLAELGFTVRIAGDGPLRSAVERAAGVDYVGRLEGGALAPYLASCDLGVISSIWEEPGLTYVLFEWLAAGRPVLSTRRGGLAEAAALGGVVSYDGSADGLVQSALDLRDETAWRALCAGLPDASGGNDFERWVDQHLAAYEVALA
jgi:glycosyltransferase involved in cell wall biosynthesis